MDETHALNVNEQVQQPVVPDFPELQRKPQTTGTSSPRLQSVLDYQASALCQSDLLRANLGSINAGLMRVCVELDERIVAALANGPAMLDGLPKLQPALDMHLRLTRQIERLAQVDQKFAAPSKLATGDVDWSTPSGSTDVAGLHGDQV